VQSVRAADDGVVNVEPILLCPLQIEADWLAKAVPALPRAAVVGPGDAVRHWIASRGRPGALPILCGLAGALRSSPAIGTAHLIDRTTTTAAAGLDAESRHARETSIRTSKASATESVPRAMAVTVAATVTDPIARRALAEEFPEADLIDCESWWFAGACEAQGLPWLIVRGVSDGPDDRLPTGVETWVGADGRNRIGRVLLSLAAHPGHVTALPMLARRGRTAMRAVAELLERIWPRLVDGTLGAR